MTPYQRSRSIRDAILTFVMIFIIASISTYNIFRESRKIFELNTKEYILKVAKLASAFVDGDLHLQITSPEQFEGPLYKQIQEPLLKILMASSDLRYIYTLIYKDNKAYFVINVQRPSDNSEPSYVMEQYEEATPYMIEALTKRMATVESIAYTDKWGTFLSGYYPIYTSTGEFVGIVGADVELTRYNEMIKEIRKPLVIGVITSFAFALTLALMVYMTGTSRIKEENEKDNTDV